jgi:hypothetical protein
MSCLQCRGGFGFGRQRLFDFNGPLDFCSQRCVDAYREQLQKQVRVRHSLGWLQELKNGRLGIQPIPITDPLNHDGSSPTL